MNRLKPLWHEASAGVVAILRTSLQRFATTAGRARTLLPFLVRCASTTEKPSAQTHFCIFAVHAGVSAKKDFVENVQLPQCAPFASLSQ